MFRQHWNFYGNMICYTCVKNQSNYSQLEWALPERGGSRLKVSPAESKYLIKKLERDRLFRWVCVSDMMWHVNIGHEG